MHLQMAWSSAGPYSSASDVGLSPHEMVGPSSTYSAGQRANTNGPDRHGIVQGIVGKRLRYEYTASTQVTEFILRRRSLEGLRPIYPTRRSRSDDLLPPTLHVSNCVDLTWEGSIHSTRSIVKPAGVPGPEGQSRPNGAEEQDSAKYGDVPDYWMTRQR